MSVRAGAHHWSPLVAGLALALAAAVLVGVPSEARSGDARSSAARVPAPAPHGLAMKSAASGDWSMFTRSVLPAASRPGVGALEAAASAALSPCEEDPTFLCTTVPVPLDRRTPDHRKVRLHVEVFPHTGPAPRADGAVFVTCGGPGCSITSGPKYGFTFFVLPEIAETKDLVYIDQRGVGLSDVIDCPAMQAGVLGTLYSSARKCHDKLGSRADMYSTTDVADDIEDVRKALGYGDIDVFGGSYAGLDMLTYAVRHPSHIRSVVLSSPALWVGVDEFYSEAPLAMPKIVATVCRRSPGCDAATARPERVFALLLKRLRNHPLVGTGIDATGESHDLKVTENLVSNFITYFNGAHFTGPGELTQATKALWRGDKVPLLRLAADNDPAGGFGGEDLRVFSSGHNLVRTCVDGTFPFDKEAPAQVRRQQFRAAYAAERDFYGPISKRAWLAPDYLGFQPAPCISSRWQDRPSYPEGTVVDDIPTLVLGGEYDLPVPLAAAEVATDVLTDSTFVTMTAAGHDSQFWSDCGPELVQRFYRDLDVGDTSCADRPAGGWWVPGSFPLHADQAPPAQQTDGPAASQHLRRLATVTGWTLFDSVLHNSYVPEDSVGLRGGTVDWTPTDVGNEWDLSGLRFTRDVVVGGHAEVDFSGGPGWFTADVSVRGPRGQTTPAHVEGYLLNDGEQMTLTLGSGAGTRTFTMPAY